MAHARQFHIGGWAAWVLAPILGLVGLVLTLADRMTGGGKADLSAEEVWTYLDDFINGRGGEWDWDDFTSIPLTAPALEAIRLEAELVALPVTAAGLDRLKALRAMAKALSNAEAAAADKEARPPS